MIYLDASVLFSVHSMDTNTPPAVHLLKEAKESFACTRLCQVEVTNALCLRLFRKEITLQQLQDSVQDFQSRIHSGVFRLLPFPESAFDRAQTLALSLTPLIGVRSSDLLHVAAAIELGAGTLYTFDQKQHKTAVAAGLKVNALL